MKCRKCDRAAFYRVATSPTAGPGAGFSTHAGIYCMSHAQERAAELMPSWKARRAERRETMAEGHKAWRASQANARTVQLKDVAAALATVEAMKGADPAWRRAWRLARTYARQQNTTTEAAIKAAQELRRSEDE